MEYSKEQVPPCSLYCDVCGIMGAKRCRECKEPVDVD